MKGYFKSAIDINDFNQALVKAAKNTTYTKEQLAKIDADTDFLYRLLMLKRNARNQLGYWQPYFILFY